MREVSYMKDLRWFFPKWKGLHNIELLADMVEDGYSYSTPIPRFRLAQYISWRSGNKISVWDTYLKTLRYNKRN